MANTIVGVEREATVVEGPGSTSTTRQYHASCTEPEASSVRDTAQHTHQHRNQAQEQARAVQTVLQKRVIAFEFAAQRAVAKSTAMTNIPGTNVLRLQLSHLIRQVPGEVVDGFLLVFDHLCHDLRAVVPRYPASVQRIP
eukprot:1513827-Rhodomonas_salina.1